MAEGGGGGEPPKKEDSELEKELEVIENEGNEIASRFQQNVSQELNSHLAKLEEEFRMAFDDKVKMVTSQCKAQQSEEMTKKQTDILRTNRVFREISRPLGDKWKPVFESLISDLSPEQKRLELEKVEREKPFMQSYKALMTWKEIRGEAFDVRQLIPALHGVGLEELVQKTLSILDSDKDALLNFSSDGSKPPSSGGASGAQAKAASLSSASGSLPASAASGDGSGHSKRTVNAEEMLDDRHLLQVAKKLGGDWEPLAKGLGVSSGEIAEIIESEGKTYQGCFKMLWNWRESKTDLSEGLGALTQQLKAINRMDAAQLLQ